MVNAPTIFSVAWAAILPFANDYVRAKLHLSRHAETELLSEICGPHGVPRSLGGTYEPPPDDAVAEVAPGGAGGSESARDDAYAWSTVSIEAGKLHKVVVDVPAPSAAVASRHATHYPQALPSYARPLSPLRAARMRTATRGSWLASWLWPCSMPAPWSLRAIWSRARVMRRLFLLARIPASSTTPFQMCARDRPRRRLSIRRKWRGFSTSSFVIAWSYAVYKPCVYTWL